MILTTTSQKLQAFIEGGSTTSAPTFTTTYADITTTTFTPDGTFGTLNGATPVDMIIAPAASTQRLIKALQINNIDTVSHTVTVRKLDTATPYILASILVLPNSFLRFSQESGWQNGPVTGPGTVSSVSFTGDGTVFNATVPGSPITTAGTFVPSLHTQSANALFAGPTTGAAAAPTFRSLVAADIPSLSSVYLPLSGGTMTGPIVLPSASAGSPALAFTHGGFFDDTTNSGVGLAAGGSQIGFFNGSTFNITIPTTGYSLAILSEAATLNQITRYGTGAAQSAVYRIQGARGTIASPTVINNGDRIGAVNVRAWGGTAFQNTAEIDFAVLQTSPSDSQMGGRISFSASTAGTVTLAEVGRFDPANGFSMFGANPVIDANRLLLLRNFTVATLPAAPAVGATAFVTDAVATIITGLGLAPVGGGTNKVPVYYDGAWKIG